MRLRRASRARCAGFRVPRNCGFVAVESKSPRSCSLIDRNRSEACSAPSSSIGTKAENACAAASMPDSGGRSPAAEESSPRVDVSPEETLPVLERLILVPLRTTSTRFSVVAVTASCVTCSHSHSRRRPGAPSSQRVTQERILSTVVASPPGTGLRSTPISSTALAGKASPQFGKKGFGGLRVLGPDQGGEHAVVGGQGLGEILGRQPAVIFRRSGSVALQVHVDEGKRMPRKRPFSGSSSRVPSRYTEPIPRRDSARRTGCASSKTSSTTRALAV